ncbi:type II toxin-antitoxin system HicA family toxin [Saccharibacillus alkalitolerans]|uniref:Type II toxin-antitoxin system HicA family toxin n=1 Tax=Saccharibacillus alkalitolerans TaxID=2705290 RepID=A0ABX0F7M5_9BACL|nr:type II toxin-antitoxin system HicA family toxin [Saccharibacillus alkalitolerans]NGZ76966.1 type II toxin-antitoxin system HicA family toxin [Saccharibacillus alkalitolerans]
MNKKKRVAIVCACAALVLCAGAAVPVARYGTETTIAMAKLNAAGEKLVELDGDSRFDRYLAKDDEAFGQMQRLMQERGWTFREQDGSGYFFEKENRKTVVTTKQLSTHTVRIQLEKGL